MCNIPDIPVLSPLPNAEIPPEEPIIEPDEEESPIRDPLRIDEYGREYYPHPRYVDSEEVPENMRLYLDSDDEDMRSFLDGYNQYDDDEEMSNHEEDYETEKEEEMEEDEQELVPSEDEEQELPAQADSPPPPHPQPVMPPQPPESLICRSVEERLWRRLLEAEIELKKRDEEIMFLHSKAEYASRQAQQWQHAAKRIAADYKESFDRSWRSVKHLQITPASQQTMAGIDHVANTIEREYDIAQVAEKRHYQWVKDHA